MQVSIYQVGERTELRREIVIEDVTEDIKAIEVCPWTSQLFLAGELGIIYKQAFDKEGRTLVRTFVIMT